MSKKVAQIISPIPIIGDVTKSLFKQPKMPDPGELPQRGAPADPAIQKRASEQMATREQTLQRQAGAAGALRSENDADVLGFSGAKKRAASRTLLG